MESMCFPCITANNGNSINNLSIVILLKSTGVKYSIVCHKLQHIYIILNSRYFIIILFFPLYTFSFSSSLFEIVLFLNSNI